MTEAEVRSLLMAHGLARRVDALMALAEPTVRIYIARDDEDALPIGASKFGGRPDLPPGIPWPAWHEPMAFIAQVNLAEVAPYDAEGALPDHGLLSFFYETNGEPLYSAGWGLPEGTSPWDYPAIDERLSWRVLYHPGDPAACIRHDIPPDRNAAARFPACAARFAAEVSLPSVNAPTIAGLGLTAAERVALIDIEEAINSGPWEEGGHRLLGHPYALPDSPYVDCEIAARRLDHAWHSATPARWRALEQEAARRWRLLLQVTSSDVAAMDWAGGGILHVCIERDALRARDFSRVWMTMQFL